MSLPEFDGFALGCLVPDSFPTGFPVFADSVPPLTLNQIRARLAGVPSAFNRRKVFGPDWIAYQGGFGSCNGWSTAKGEERSRVLRGLERVKLSGADAYSQMNGGRDRGSTLADGLKVVQANGIAPEELNPGTDRIYPNRISAEAKAARARFKGFEAQAADTEEEFATGILLGFVGIVAVDVHRGFTSLDGRGVVQSGNGSGNHSVGVDDIRVSPSGELEYDMFNSHGTNYGDQGRGWLTWDRHLRETVKYHRFWFLRSTLDDPKGDNPPAARE